MFIEVKNVRVHYEQYGEEGPKLLLLHGWGCSIALWKPVIDRLAPFFRITAIDFPGHGESGRPPEPWGAGEFADMVAQLMRALDLTGCDIIGHSHGGRVSLKLALDSPEVPGRLVLTGSAGLRGKATARQTFRRAAFKQLRGACDALDCLRIFGGLPEQARDALRKHFGSSDYNALDEEMRKTFVRLVNTDLTDDLPRIRASTLLVWGDRDTETPLWMGQTMEKGIPDAGLVVLEGGTHFAYLEQPDRFCRIVKQFLLGG